MLTEHEKSEGELPKESLARRATRGAPGHSPMGRSLPTAGRGASIWWRMAECAGCLVRMDWVGFRHRVYVDYLRFVKPRELLDTPSDVKLDVVFVAHEKDLQPLRSSIVAIRKYLLHPIGKVFIIARDSPQFRRLCDEHGCDLIDEGKVLPITKKDIRYVDRTGSDRAAWLFQQLLKLGADTIATQEHYFVIDADTVLIRPCAFNRKGRTIMFCTEKEYHRPYYEAFRRLLKTDKRFPASFVCHQMLFEKTKLREMKAVIERSMKRPWYQAILDVVGTSEPSFFSEYETYANFLMANYPGEIEVQYFANLALPVQELTRLQDLGPELSSQYQSISFHAYLT